ncbi:MAG: ABC transporter ATP-binding protein [Acetobacteraceae bacterium]|nr:ABC transporter ATP-binding protein [Acetobacteraceae bacterium]
MTDAPMVDAPMVDALAIRDMSAGYGEAIVLRNLSLRVPRTDIVAVLGKNGMGKSTLLKSIMGYLPKATGAIALDGHDVTQVPPHRMARRGVSYIAQEKALFQDLTVEENIRLALARGSDRAAAMATVERCFPFLLKRLRQQAGTLSGGEQKMLLVARALAVRARLLLIDEITEGLQPSVVTTLAQVIRDERARFGTTILLIEQNIGFALEVADRYAVLDRGEIVDGGPTAGATARVAGYLSV